MLFFFQLIYRNKRFNQFICEDQLQHKISAVFSIVLETVPSIRRMDKTVSFMRRIKKTAETLCRDLKADDLKKNLAENVTNIE